MNDLKNSICQEKVTGLLGKVKYIFKSAQRDFDLAEKIIEDNFGTGDKIDELKKSIEIAARHPYSYLEPYQLAQEIVRDFSSKNKKLKNSSLQNMNLYLKSEKTPYLAQSEIINFLKNENSYKGNCLEYDQYRGHFLELEEDVMMYKVVYNAEKKSEYDDPDMPILYWQKSLLELLVPAGSLMVIPSYSFAVRVDQAIPIVAHDFDKQEFLSNFGKFHKEAKIKSLEELHSLTESERAVEDKRSKDVLRKAHLQTWNTKPFINYCNESTEYVPERYDDEDQQTTKDFKYVIGEKIFSQTKHGKKKFCKNVHKAYTHGIHGFLNPYKAWTYGL